MNLKVMIKRKNIVIVLAVVVFFVGWHDVVALEEVGSYTGFAASGQAQSAELGSNYLVGAGHSVEVQVLHPWLLDVIPLTSSSLIGVLPFGYNLVPVYIAFLFGIYLFARSQLLSQKPVKTL